MIGGGHLEAAAAPVRATTEIDGFPYVHQRLHERFDDLRFFQCHPYPRDTCTFFLAFWKVAWLAMIRNALLVLCSKGNLLLYVYDTVVMCTDSSEHLAIYSPPTTSTMFGWNIAMSHCCNSRASGHMADSLLKYLFCFFATQRLSTIFWVVRFLALSALRVPKSGQSVVTGDQATLTRHVALC